MVNQVFYKNQAKEATVTLQNEGEKWKQLYLDLLDKLAEPSQMPELDEIPHKKCYDSKGNLIVDPDSEPE